ncbi:MAG: RimK family protein [Alphaproteobacteria bacterium]|nr:RimK family protein [Alphaproteobacteria bacterium]
MTNYTHLVIVDTLTDAVAPQQSRYVITAQDYISNKYPDQIMAKANLRVINLCHNYEYLRLGYYCSLLADARGHRCIPATSDIIHTNWKRIYKSSLPELESLLNAAPISPGAEEYFYFGRTQNSALQNFGRKLFDAFRLPLIKVAFAQKADKWKITQVEPLSLSDITQDISWFNECLSKYTGEYWNKKKQDNDKYWLAILHDPEEKMPPSNAKALKKFIQIGKKKRFYVELITKHNLDSLLEYDALFIRETTNVNHYTYRFAQKAESEGIPCIDDTASILRCCNKVYLHELLHSKKIKTPHSFFLNRRQKELPMPAQSEYPLVVKVPDGAFSLGVFKVNNAEEYTEKVQALFKKSELILVQEFLPSDYDWRIVLLGGKPLFACKYYMAKKHWQIYNHGAKTNKSGDSDCVPLPDVPKLVLQTAIRAAGLIGNGLYGVDIKEIEGVPYIIEVNDNPSIDAGVEDAYLGDALYEAIFDHFQHCIDA